MDRARSEAVIQIEGFVKHYGQTKAVDGIDLAVGRGEVLGFLGPNGAGKTTTIRTLLDFIRPTQGRIRVFGLDAREEGVMIRRRVGYLAGDLAMPGGRTGRQLLSLLALLRPDVEAAHVAELAARLGTPLDRRVRDLSRGNRQKVGVVQAFMGRPDLLVLDEPTTGLDPIAQEVVHELVLEAKRGGRTVFLSSHNLAEVQHLCDRVAIIRDGKLVEVASVPELRQRTVRHVNLLFSRPVDPAEFSALANVRRAVGIGPRLRLTVDGALDAVVKKAAEHPLEDLVSHEPDLEEIFRHYYRGDADDE